MKTVKRVFALLLVVSILFTGFGWQKEAAADMTPVNNVETLGSTKVSETPGELFYMGEWSYWVEGGTATIAGYASLSETSLKIPEKLGGYPVTGIGQLAFSDNTALKYVQFHTNVTRIADDAFEGLSGVTIAAYHGAYALIYASERGMIAKDLSTQCVFANGVIDLQGAPAGSYSNLSEVGAVFNAKLATYLTVGQILAFPKSTAFPTGLAVKIEGLEQNEDRITLVFSQPEWGDCIESFSGEDEVIVDWDSVIMADDVEMSDAEASAAWASKNLTVKIKLKNGRTVTTSFKLDFGKPTINYKVGWQWWGILRIPEVSEFSLDMPTTATFSLSYGDKAKLDAERNGQGRLVDRKTICTIPAASVGGVFNGYITLDWVFEFSGSIVVSSTFNCTLHLAKKNGKVTKTIDRSFNNFKIEANAEIKTGPELKIYFVLGWYNFSIRVIEFSAGVFFKATGKASYTTVSKGTVHGMFCMDAKLSVEITVTGKIGIVKLAKHDVSLCLTLSHTWPIGTIWSGHLDNMEKVSSCTLKGRNVVFIADGKKIKSVTGDVNGVLAKVSIPEKKGYKSDGWYVDAKASGLSGSDYKFDFGKDVIPYCGQKGTFTLKAQYTKIEVSDVKLNKSSQTIYTNDTKGIQLKATVSPSNAYDTSVTWKSSNTSVATVSKNGLVKPVGPGKATITCASKDNPQKKDTFTVTVKQYVTGLALTAPNACMVAGETMQLNAAVTPSNASNKELTWSSSNASVATVSSGLVTAVDAGKVTITAKAKDGSNVSKSYSITVYAAPSNTPQVQVTDVALDQTALTISTTDAAGAQLHATVTPANADDTSVTWSSSNEDVATVDNSGHITPIAGGTTVIECRSVSNPHKFATCAVTVTQPVAQIVISGKHAIEVGDETTLQAVVTPATATNKNVTWSSSDTAIATVDGSGVVHGLANGYAFITAAATDGSGVISAQFRVQVGEVPPVNVESITLNQTAIEQYTNDPNQILLEAIVLPEDADDPSVTWSSSDPSVVTVDEDGAVTVVGVGVATITCRSVSNQSVFATCQITIKQYVEQLYIQSNVGALLPGETAQFTVDVYPENANNKNVTWSSDNTAVATVDQTGLVTAVSPGTAQIVVTAADGSQVSDAYTVTVSKELELTASMVNDTVYTQGSDKCVIAYVNLTRESALRMAKAGKNLQWSMTRKSGSGNVTMSVSDITVTGNDGVAYTSSMATLVGSEFPTAGTEVYTVTCRTDTCEDSFDVTVTADGTQYASEVKLTNAAVGYNTLTANMNEEVLVPAAPFSADGKPVPTGMEVSLSGDYYYGLHGSERTADTGVAVSFDESGVYSADVRYRKGNLSYSVTGTFRIADENGIVHVRAEGISLSDYSLYLVEGESAALTATVTPEDAFNKTVRWTSSDPSVATVTAAGTVQGVAPGLAVISCAASDDSGMSAMCIVTVESYLQLDEEELNFTVYKGGDDHTMLDIVNVTYDSQKRLTRDGLNVSWDLTRISGNSTEIGLSEYVGTWEKDIAVSGNIINLLRVNQAGTDEYLLTCKTDGHSDSCVIRVTVVDQTLPQSVALNKTNYTGTVDEWIPVELDYTLQPAGSSLPADVVVTIEGGNAFLNGLSDLYSYTEQENVIFGSAGTYTANVVFSGTNYRYSCPISFTVSDEEGNVPTIITDVVLSETELLLSPGETEDLSASVEPVGAVFSSVNWSSSDTSVATVSSGGKVTAIGTGWATIIASVPESDYEGTCLVYVEDGINFREGDLERTVFVDGTTRMILDTLLLTDNTCAHLEEEPEWTLRRVSGNSLTLRAIPCETVNAAGDTVYGCGILLYSVSKEGDTVYELVCTEGNDSATTTITFHSVYRERLLPASIQLSETEFTVDIGELLVLKPTITTYPSDSRLPAGMIVSCEGGKQYQEALNARDTYISQSISTFSFNKAGTYEANLIYAYSNMKYVIPMVFRVRDANGFVPVQGSKVMLNHPSLYMVRGEMEQMEAVFTPANATNQAVTWTSSDPSVATVDAAGKVTAVANGTATIYCEPADTECSIVSCGVTVEDYLTVDVGVTSQTLYVQGTQTFVIAHPMLSVGTMTRLEEAGLEPVWTVTKTNVSHADLVEVIDDKDAGVMVSTDRLLSNGTDTYTIRCDAGSFSWSQTYSLNVIDLGSTAPATVTIRTPQVAVAINEPVTIDFTPVVTPSGASMPNGMISYGYVGIGDFYKALDYSVYAESGNTVTAAFKQAGKYLLTKTYMLRNLEYVTTCVITVGGSQSGLNVLSATETNVIVYNGGKSGAVSSVTTTDSSIDYYWRDDIRWTIERVSGNSLTAALKNNGDGVDVFVASVEKNGTDVWRVKCEFGGMTESIDITLTAADPRGDIPQAIALANDQVSGMIGNWLYLPLGVTYSPTGSMLPDQGDEFWSFSFDQAGEDRSVHKIEGNLLKVCFTMSGYYTGTLTYRSGNVSYAIPVYFVIEDEENVIRQPNMQLYLVNAADTVYPEGDTNVSIGKVVIAESLSTYSTGASVAYMNGINANWSISQSGSGAALSLRKVSNNVYDLMLDSIQSSGNVTYTVTCQAGGKSYTTSGTLRVAQSSEDRPQATLKHTTYRTEVGQELSLDRNMYSGKDGSILQSSTSWDPSQLLSAVGYEIAESDDAWKMTFYRSGTYKANVYSRVGNLNIETPITIDVAERGEELELTVLKLPTALQEVGEEAFEGTVADIIDLRGTQITVIRKNAFRNCVNAVLIYLPNSVRVIEEDAFTGCLNAKICCESNSYAAGWAAENGFTVVEP